MEEKHAWNLDPADCENILAQSTYKSLAGSEEVIPNRFREQAGWGWMKELIVAEVGCRFGSRLQLGARGVVEEKSKFRVIHDGSHENGGQLQNVSPGPSSLFRGAGTTLLVAGDG